MRKIILLLMFFACARTFGQDFFIQKLPFGSAPVLDGTIEHLWDTIAANNITQPFIDESPTLTSYWKATWDDDGVYVLVSVSDNFNCDQWCSGQDNWLSDKPEVYFDVNSVLKDGLGPSTSNSGHYSFAPGFENGLNSFYKAEVDNSYKYAYKRTGSNYNFEYFIRFSMLKDKLGSVITGVAGRVMGFDVCVIDRDSANDVRRRKVWKNIGNVGENWNNMNDAGTIALANPKADIRIISPTGIIANFGTYKISPNAVSDVRDVVFAIKNTGLQDLVISSVGATGLGFSVAPLTKKTCKTNDTIQLHLKFTSATEGTFSGNLSINSNSYSNDNFYISCQTSAVKGTRIKEGNVSGKWTKAKSPYFVNGNITIPDDSVLTIEPGVHVLFQSYNYFNINGSLKAEGTKTDSIYFSAADSSGFSNLESQYGAWQGFILTNSSWNMYNNDSTKLNYCVIEGAKAVAGSIKEVEWNRGAALLLYNFKAIRISNCAFRNNYAMGDGGAILIDRNAEINISNTTFNNNITRYGGGAVYAVGLSKVKIENCNVFNNKAREGAGFLITGISAKIFNSYIHNNSAVYGSAIEFINSNSILVNNVITNNESSSNGAVVVNNCQPIIYNNDICFNKSHWGGAGLLIWDLSPAIVKNNILWGNVMTMNGFDEPNQIDITTSIAHIKNCIVEGGGAQISFDTKFRADTATILSSDPLFTAVPEGAGVAFSPLAANWRVAGTSVAVNSGQNVNLTDYNVSLDFYKQKRVLHSNIDIGATEKLNQNILFNGNVTKNTLWAADTIKITGNVLVTDSVTLTIAPGTIVEMQGNYTFKIHGRILCQGLAEAPIKFSIKDTSGFANIDTTLGGWGGITLSNAYSEAYYKMSEDSIIFDHTIIEYAKNSATNWDQNVGGAFQVKYYSKLRISNCIIRNNIAGQGAGICIDGFSNILVLNNKFYNNRTTKWGCAVSILGNSRPNIIGNLICNNNTIDGGLGITDSYPLVYNNVIANNFSKYNGGGVQIISSNPVFSNNTIVNNLCNQEGAGMYIDACNAAISNCIIWGNKAWSGNNSIVTRSQPSFVNCLIEDGRDGIGNYGGDVEILNLQKDNPAFLKPTNGYGLSFSAINANFSISPFSAAINKGVSNDLSKNYTSDFVGNARVNGGVIDIGAFENTAGKIEFIDQPKGGFYCLGNNITLSVAISDTGRFQWQKDGTDIIGATSKDCKINGLKETNTGNYICIASNSYGKIYSSPAFIQVNSLPVITANGKNIWANENEEVNMQITADGSKPLMFKWYRNNVLIDTIGVGTYTINTFTSALEGTYVCKVSNACGLKTSTNIEVRTQPKICVVTADETTGKNKVVWERKTNSYTKGYNVYRESMVRDVYEKIGYLAYNVEGIFVDETSVPEAHQSLYKIAAVTTSGETSPKSNSHKTLFLQYVSSEGGVNLIWQPYEIENGSIEFKSYKLYKGTDSANLQLFATISSSLNAYTDADPLALTTPMYYRIHGVLNDACNSQKLLKVGGGPFVETVSNLEDNRLRGTGISLSTADRMGLCLFPQPATNRLSVNYNLTKNEPVAFEIINLLGAQMATINAGQGISGSNTFNIDLLKYNLQGGLYFLKLKTNSQIAVKQFIIKK